MATITRDMVGDALQQAARLWAENYKLVLYDVRFPQLPGAGEDPLFKGFAWLNFGVNTTRTMFPLTLAGELVRAWAVDNPSWSNVPDRTYVTNMGVNRAQMPVTMADAWPRADVDLAAAQQRMVSLALPR